MTREVRIEDRTLGMRTEVFNCWLLIRMRRRVRTEVFTCWLPICMRRDVRIEDNALGTRAEVNRRR